jgi:septum formation protein
VIPAPSSTDGPARLVLASGSPRRRQLLRLIGLPHLVRPAQIDESPLPDETAVELVERAARTKALAVAADEHRLPVLAADTIVERDGQILGKPADTDAAAAMLQALSGVAHHVHTAVALAMNGTCESLVDTAEVRFLELTPQSIRWYVATGEPMDKAGAYAIQGIGGLFVAGISGSPHTVVGLPIHRLHELFQRHGRSLWHELHNG